MSKEIEKTVKSIQKVASDLKDKTSDVDETIKGAVAGGVLGYIISDQNKERNTILGAGAGYVAGKYAKSKRKSF